jgi:hypothetical protein
MKKMFYKYYSIIDKVINIYNIYIKEIIMILNKVITGKNKQELFTNFINEVTRLGRNGFIDATLLGSGSKKITVYYVQNITNTTGETAHGIILTGKSDQDVADQITAKMNEVGLDKLIDAEINAMTGKGIVT